MVFKKLPILTPRLLIRGPEVSDLPQLLSAMRESRAELQRWMGWAKPWPTDSEIANLLTQSVANFVGSARHKRFECFDRITGRFLVSLGCTISKDNPSHYHISYWARTGDMGKGYTTEAVTALCQYLFAEADATMLETGHEIGNDASRRVIEKCGFSFQRTIAKPLHNDPDTIRHEHIFIMTNQPSNLEPRV